MSRNLAIVVDQIMQEVPKSFRRYGELKAQLEDRVESYKYTAPELVWLRFQEVGEILGMELGEPNTAWKRKIVDIFADKVKPKPKPHHNER